MRQFLTALLAQDDGKVLRQPHNCVQIGSDLAKPIKLLLLTCRTPIGMANDTPGQIAQRWRPFGRIAGHAREADWPA
jgi:hypothetical protein